MNHVIVKIRLRGNQLSYRKILSGVSLFALPPDLEPHVPYNVGHNLDEDSWFGIEHFSQKDYCLDLLKSEFNSAEYDMFEIENIRDLDFICSYQDEDIYYFQKIGKSQLLFRKLIHLGDEYRFEENSKTIVINSLADAIYEKKKDILYFKRLSTISSIFKGIDTLYREATAGETTEFLNKDFICLDNNFSSEKVGKANRRRIAMAMDTLQHFEVEQKNAVITYIGEYCPDINLQDTAFRISTDDDLKRLLYGIEQRYYTTLVGNEKRCANSIIRIE